MRNETRINSLSHTYDHLSKQFVGYAHLNPAQKTEVSEILISAAINGMPPVNTAMEAGIPQLIASTGLSSLIHLEGVLESGTLKLLVKS